MVDFIIVLVIFNFVVIVFMDGVLVFTTAGRAFVIFICTFVVSVNFAIIAANISTFVVAVKFVCVITDVIIEYFVAHTVDVADGIIYVVSFVVVIVGQVVKAATVVVYTVVAGHACKRRQKLVKITLIL